MMEFPIVSLTEGDIRGRQQKDINGSIFFSFEGIAYGKPPIGDLRFKAPVPVEPWNGVRDALVEDYGNLCKQETFFKKEKGYGRKWHLEGSEDCLNLNVYTKELPTDKKGSPKPKPVMVFIHGGGCVTGTTRLYGPGILMTEDIVLVSIHYRMGAFGFLVLEDPKLEVTGNAALKDQVLALKWIQNNIAAFNGDRNNVTVFGHSGGAGCVSLLVLSPSAAGLFHKAIILSGSAISSWVYGDSNCAKRLAEALGYSGTDQKEILKFLQDQPAEKIYEGQLEIGDLIQPSSLRPFSFVVENKNSKDAFLTEQPIKLLTSGKFNHIPIVIGFTNMEGIVYMGDGAGSPYGVQCFEENAMPPVFLGLERNSEEFKMVANRIKKFYFGDSEPQFHSLPTVHLCSDTIIIRGLLKQTEYLWKNSKQPVYLYRVSVPMDFGEPFSSLNINGVPHGEELPYIFTRRMEPELLSCDKDLMRKRMVALFTNFAKYGKPVPTVNEITNVEWNPVNNERLQYLDIGDQLSIRTNPEKERMNFWDELFKSYPQAADY